MLVELAVRDLGVIEELRLLLGPGLTAVTGETGAGKTLVVGAIELLVGGRADPQVVRPGADEAWVEGRFVLDGDEGDEEVVVARAVPRSGRSRAYVDGRLATVASLAEVGRRLVDLHGQHAHQSLLSTAVQRGALDRFAGIDPEPLRRARAEVRAIDEALAALGGDERARAREIDLLRYQVEELDEAGLDDPDEDERLDAREDELAQAGAHRQAAAEVLALLADDDGAIDRTGAAVAALAGRAPFAAAEARLRAVQAELADLVGEVRGRAEAIEDDPEALADVRARRQRLHELRRKYGDTLAEVIEFAATARSRLAELEDHDRRAAELDARRAAALAELATAAAAVAAARRRAAPGLGAAVEAHLVELAMPGARLGVAVEGPDPADDVSLTLAANPGSPPAPLAKVASGGELARAMLALRLVLTAGPGTLVFDEVDAGVGGTAALAVGRALARLGAERQVLVVTHLPQVAAFADAHVQVTKRHGSDDTVSVVERLDDGRRVVELARMLSGQPDSPAARGHAEELLAAARAGLLEREAS
ncbi:MAG: DNA repair protein RecN [Acidimicrobiia bacterium]